MVLRGRHGFRSHCTNWLTCGRRCELVEYDHTPRFAYLNEKTREELRAMQQEAQVALGRYEEALRLGTTVLAECG
jgi:hypothetical protein